MNNRRKFMQRAATASIAIGFCRGDSIECDAGFRWLAPNGTHFVRNEPRARCYLSSTTSGDVDFEFGSDGFCFSFLGGAGVFEGVTLGWL